MFVERFSPVEEDFCTWFAPIHVQFQDRQSHDAYPRGVASKPVSAKKPALVREQQVVGAASGHSHFDRVVLINRSTKQTAWVLGEEDNYTVLREQHNPVLLSTDPPTVLVADSDNHRVVEYKKEGTHWVKTWEYSKGLRWPRDADRLPNGNTIIVNTREDQILEVTPQKEVVWKMDVPRIPYDIERGRYGDEPSGPPMHTISRSNASGDTNQSQSGIGKITEAWGQYYSFSRWIFPPGVGQLSFAALHLSVLVILGWVVFELRRWWR